MFFAIFGIDHKTKQIGERGNVNCPHCGMTRATVTETFNFFHLFFLPIIKWNRIFQIKLRCGCIYEATKEQAHHFLAGENLDMSTLKNVRCTHDYRYKRCKDCKRSFDSSYQYCPLCGKPLDDE